MHEKQRVYLYKLGILKRHDSQFCVHNYPRTISSPLWNHWPIVRRHDGLLCLRSRHHWWSLSLGRADMPPRTNEEGFIPDSCNCNSHIGFLLLRRHLGKQKGNLISVRLAWFLSSAHIHGGLWVSSNLDSPSWCGGKYELRPHQFICKYHGLYTRNQPHTYSSRRLKEVHLRDFHYALP